MEALSLEEEIDNLRNELNNMYIDKEERKIDGILEYSRKLDKLIVHYHSIFSKN